YINYTNMSQSQVKEIIFPEGILKIGDRVIFGDYNNLTTLTLPSTLESGSFNTISISGTGLTDTEGFKKVTKIKNLSIQNSQIQDLSGLSGLTQLEGINLSGNKDLTDISPLKSLKNLKNLTLVDTKVSKESQAELLSAVDMKFYMTSGLQEIKVLPTIQDTVTPQLLDYTIEAEDQGIAKFQYDGSRWFVQGLKAGKTRGIFKYNGKPTGNSFAIEVEGLGKEPEQPIGDKIENLPTLGRAATPSGAETLGLYDNGQLWQVSGDSAVKVMDNVKKYVGMETYVSKNGISWTMIEDKNGTLWTREIKGMEKPVLNERVKNVVKYVGVSAYGSNGIIGGCALDRVNNFWNLGNDNTNKIAQTDVKDFDALGFANTNTGVAVLKTNGDLLVKLYPSSNVAETDYVKVADGVTALESDERFVKEDGFYRYSLDTSVSPAKINTVKLGEDVKNTYAGGVFVVKTDGSTWYSDQYKILETEFKSYISQYMDGATTYFILDQNNTLWKWDYRYGSAEESVA
ncbi:MAG: leucine-rich repeat domain-containing protein, partial [Eubacterium sp.]